MNERGLEHQLVIAGLCPPKKRVFFFFCQVLWFSQSTQAAPTPHRWHCIHAWLGISSRNFSGNGWFYCSVGTPRSGEEHESQEKYPKYSCHEGISKRGDTKKNSLQEKYITI